MPQIFKDLYQYARCITDCTIAEDISLHQAKLEKVRISIERGIGLIKNKYTTLQGAHPISLIKHQDDSDYATIHKIVTVCASLTKLFSSVIRYAP